MKQPILSIIVISFNTGNLTLQTIESVFTFLEKGKLKPSDLDIIVIDNHSSDDSVALLKKTFDGKIRVIKNDDNLGFARANNQGVELAKGEYVLLLNSDTIVGPHALDDLLACLSGDPTIGAVAAKLANVDGSYQPQGGVLPRLRNIAAWWLWPFPGYFTKVAPYQDPREISGKGFVPRGWVGGTALLLKKKLYQAVGGLDENIFMYGEDVDLCLRISMFGLRVGICADSVITHLGSASSSSIKARLGEVKGIIHIFKKHKPSWELPFLRLILLKGAILRLFYFGILKGSREARNLYLQVIGLSLK